MQRAERSLRPRLSRERLYDVVTALTRLCVGWMFAGYGTALRGREDAVAEHLLAAGLGAPSSIAVASPIVLVAFSLAFAVGLLTWLTGPVLAAAAVVGALAAGPLAPFPSWEVTALVSAVCVLMALNAGRCSWDHLVLSPQAPRRKRRHPPHGPRGRSPAFSARLPEHAPPLLYPGEQAALRRPYRL